jgi:hypothetical protein
MYKLMKNLDNVVTAVRFIETGAVIPFDPDNTDYQSYLAWLAEGNQPEAAE